MNQKIPRLGVNLDHVATIRQARGENYPSLQNALKVAINSGADQITLHLREDRRHIQDFDILPALEECKAQKVLFNLEMAIHSEMIDFAISVKPDWICLVPEKREEKTTEGGLHLSHDQNRLNLKNAIDKLREKTPSTKISLFVEADVKNLEHLFFLAPEAVEIHTGSYAKDFLLGKSTISYEQNFQTVFKEMKKRNIGYHAGHGLTDKSLMPLLELKIFAEYNIGHWIVSESIFRGLSDVIKEMKSNLLKYPLA